MKNELSNLEAFSMGDVKLPDKESMVKIIQNWICGEKKGGILDLFPVVKHVSSSGVNRVSLYIIYLIIEYCRDYPINSCNDQMIFDIINTLTIKEIDEVGKTK